jgi:hypothetical protein
MRITHSNHQATENADGSQTVTFDRTTYANCNHSKDILTGTYDCGCSGTTKLDSYTVAKENRR